MTDENDLTQKLRGRAAFLRDRGEIKSPELLEAAADAIDTHLAHSGEGKAVGRLIVQEDHELVDNYGVCRLNHGVVAKIPPGDYPLYTHPAPASDKAAQGVVLAEVTDEMVHIALTKYHGIASPITQSAAMRAALEAAIAHPRPTGDEAAKDAELARLRRGWDQAVEALDAASAQGEGVASLMGEQAGEVVAFRIVGRLGPYPWVDGKPDPEPEFIVGEGERLELAYGKPRPTGVPDGISEAPFYWEKGGGVKQDSATGYCNGWNDCRKAMLAAAPDKVGG